jgi:hypothetical protein
VMQPHDQRGVDVVQEPVELIADKHGGIASQFIPFAAVVAGEDEQRRTLRIGVAVVFAQAQALFDQRRCIASSTILS